MNVNSFWLTWIKCKLSHSTIFGLYVFRETFFINLPRKLLVVVINFLTSYARQRFDRTLQRVKWILNWIKFANKWISCTRTRTRVEHWNQVKWKVFLLDMIFLSIIIIIFFSFFTHQRFFHVRRFAVVECTFDNLYGRFYSFYFYSEYLIVA